MTKSNTKIGFLSALVLSLALTGFGCDSDKKDVVVLDAAVDHSPSDAQQIASDSSTKLDVVVSLEVGSAETSGDDARLTDDGAVVTKDAPAPSADVAVDANRTASDATVD